MQLACQHKEVRRLIEGTKALTWVFTGDDVTHGAFGTNGCRSYTEVFAHHVRWELRRLLDVVINTGVHGGRIKNLLKNLKWRVSRFNPNVVSVLVGMQDCIAGPAGRGNFQNCLECIVRQLDARKVIVLLNTPGRIVLPSSGKYRDLPAYVDLIRSVATSHDIPLIDHWAYWERCKAAEDDLRAWLTEDGVHPCARGHQAMAELILGHAGVYDSRRWAARTGMGAGAGRRKSRRPR